MILHARGETNRCGHEKRRQNTESPREIEDLHQGGEHRKLKIEIQASITRDRTVHESDMVALMTNGLARQREQTKTRESKEALKEGREHQRADAATGRLLLEKRQT